MIMDRWSTGNSSFIIRQQSKSAVRELYVSAGLHLLPGSQFEVVILTLSVVEVEESLYLSLHLQLLSLFPIQAPIHRHLVDGRPYFHTTNPISTKKQLFQPGKSRVSFNSTEEQSSSRREQTRGHQQNRQRDSQALRKLAANGWNRESSYNECDDGKYGKCGLYSQQPRAPGEQSVVIRAPEPGLRKSESRGDLSKEKSPHRFYEPNGFHDYPIGRSHPEGYFAIAVILLTSSTV
jgi:hypothetical protein